MNAELDCIKEIKKSSAYTQGRGHIKENIPCQDRTYSHVNKDANLTIISLSDGAGSCGSSDIGAEIVTKIISKILIDNFDELLFEIQKDRNKVSKYIISNLLIELDEYAKTKNIPIKELSSTLLFVIVGIKQNKFISGHLGDGVIGYMDNNGKLDVLSHPENGEYSNSTYFVTSRNSHNYLRLFYGSISDISGFIIMSDGSEDSLYNKQKKILSSVCSQIISWLETNSQSEVSAAIKDNLDEKIKMRTFDDCSISVLKIIKDSMDNILDFNIRNQKLILNLDNTIATINRAKVLSYILRNSPKSVNEISTAVGLTNKTVNSHITALKENESIGIAVNKKMSNK